MKQAESQGPVAVVTGGSRGIGRAIVRHLSNVGYSGGFCYQSDTASADSTLQEIGGDSWISRQVDVRNADKVKAFVDEVAHRYGRLDLAVHSAGIVGDALLPAMSPELWESVVQTNLTGAFNLCRASSTQMMRSKSGSIVLVGSIVGRDGNIGQANYSASKAGLIGLCKSAAVELARWQIRVNVVAPGFIVTDMTEELVEHKKASFLDRVPLRRFGQPEDIAKAVLFLGSSASSYITRQTIYVDGGMLV
ncbi:SDR family NAD(P)-dependent oxidoreductase [Actinomyces slackii]|uniref:3-oxoacyl-[acyl-carrier-protein] reductase FabG n=1 Tax=Actinomyces slackii TaxID=52774 RepID=A0A448KFP9_9ACTO|nr:SDR family NAD(P)-dependent oxidoreductase [Actinomyces slackii]VEG75776.1 3-oxoacyl-[acyl-carrier-protein] reductase FabG [Actinomyces slackii]